MKSAKTLTAVLAMLALSACGDDASTSAEAPASERSAETSAPASTPETAAGETETAKAITLAEPTPMPEPVNPIIAFESEDGTMSLGRKSLTMVSPVHDADSNEWSVFIQMDKEAAADFYTLTAETTGEALAVVVDDMTVSTPVLETAVYGGGFVFRVDGNEVASAVVAKLNGKPPTPTAVEVTAGDALPATGGDDTDTASNATPEDG